MKHSYSHILLAGLALLTCTTANADYITYNGTTREYKKYVPADLGENRPLLISMHGMNQDAGYQMGMLQVESVADTAKFVTVFPEGIDRSWDIGGQRDIQFVLALIDKMVDQYHIDRNRVYLSGFSMGGMFTYHAMNHIADKIAAFAPFSGYPMGGQPFTSSRPVPIIHTHGTTDDVVTFDRVQASLDGWIARNGCSPTPMVTESYRYNGCTRYQWGPGDGGAEVVLIERANKGHWIANDYFKGVEEIWNFCKRYSLNDSAPVVTFNSPKSDTEIAGVGRTVDFSISIDVNATSADSEIAQVKVYGDNQLLTTLTEPPYVYEWTNVDRGQHFIKAEAVDANGVSIARAVPVNAKNYRNAYNLSREFVNGNMPNGWIGIGGRATRVGPQSDFSGGPRVIEFKGSPRDFDKGIYTGNTLGKTNGGYLGFGEKRTNVRLLLTPGTYSFTFTPCNYDCPDGAAVRCQLFNYATDELINEVTVTPTVNIGGAPNLPFSGSQPVSFQFSTGQENMMVYVKFYTSDDRGADMVLGNISMRQVSTEGITDIEATDAQPTDVKYYDFFGRELSNPTGPAIRVTRYSDGSVKTLKAVF